MIINFNSQEEAESKLKADRYKLLGNGYWMSFAGLTIASIHPKAGCEAVQVFYQPSIG